METNPEMTEIVKLADEDLKRHYNYIRGFKGKYEHGEEGN